MESIFSYSYSFDIILHGLFLSVLVFAGILIYFTDFEKLYKNRGKDGQEALTEEPVPKLLGSILQIAILLIPGLSTAEEVQKTLIENSRTLLGGVMVIVNLLALVLIFYFFGLIGFPISDKFTERPAFHLGLDQAAKTISSDPLAPVPSANNMPRFLIDSAGDKLKEAYNYDYDNWIKMRVFKRIFADGSLLEAFRLNLEAEPKPVLLLPTKSAVMSARLDSIIAERKRKFIQDSIQYLARHQYLQFLAKDPKQLFMSFYFQGHDRFLMVDTEKDGAIQKRFHQNQRFSNLAGTASLGFFIFFLFAYFNFLAIFFRSFKIFQNGNNIRFNLINALSVLLLLIILWGQDYINSLWATLFLSVGLPFVLCLLIYSLSHSVRQESYGLLTFIAVLILYCSFAGYVLSYSGWIYFEEETCYAVYNAIINKGPAFLQLPLK